MVLLPFLYFLGIELNQGIFIRLNVIVFCYFSVSLFYIENGDLWDVLEILVFKCTRWGLTELLTKYFCLKIAPDSCPIYMAILRTVSLVTLGPPLLTTVDQLNAGP